MLEEDYKTQDKIEINRIRKELFESDIDDEHIQPFHDEYEKLREDIWNECKENINSAGNLMILEQSINRSISNSSYQTKILRYPQSNFAIVKKHCDLYTTWSLSNCIERKEKEIKKIFNYIFSEKKSFSSFI